MTINQDEMNKYSVIISSIAVVMSILIIGLIFLTSCSLSFTNVNTHGTSSDVIDEEMSPTTDMKASVTPW